MCGARPSQPAPCRAAGRRPGPTAAPRRPGSRRYLTTRASPSKSANWSSAAKSTTRAQRFEGLVVAHQRRALRIAFQYLRDAAEADEAVQDAFVKVFSHIGSYREAWPFEVWFTRILINGCLDRRKARVRRDRWIVPADDTVGWPPSRPTRPSPQAISTSACRPTRKRGCSRANGGRA